MSIFKKSCPVARSRPGLRPSKSASAQSRSLISSGFSLSKPIAENCRIVPNLIIPVEPPKEKDAHWALPSLAFCLLLEINPPKYVSEGPQSHRLAGLALP
jgi:hypothetical protein